MRTLTFIAPLALLAGCAAVGPDYRTPAVPVTNAFVGGSGGQLAEVAGRAWWKEYDDPLLSELVETGMRQSLDILQAQERIREARAALRETGVNAALDGSAELARTRAGGDNTAVSTSTTRALSASVVLDMFGGIRRGREAATANLAAAQADVGTERLAWLAELVGDYADARYYQQAIALTRQTIATREDTLKITEQEAQAGAATDYDLAEARATLQAAQADLPGYLAAFRAEVFAIATLLNTPAGPLMTRMEKGAAQLKVPRDGATGVPADLLRNRPDIRSYEAILHQQVAEIGVAEADLYPSISLGGTVSGTRSATSWSFGPTLTEAVFDQGALRAARDVQVSAAKQAEIDYRAAVLAAVEDVQTAQSNLQQYRAQASRLQQAADSYGQALALARDTYRAGSMTLLDLLDTDRSEASARISAASARNSAAQEWATLQLAIGAGASYARSPEEAPAPAAAP